MHKLLRLITAQSQISKQPTPFDLAMMVLSVVAMVMVAMVFFAPLDHETKRILIGMDTLICLIFITHFTTGLIKADDKKDYMFTHWLDLVASIPFVEQTRILRFLQIFRAVAMLRLAKSILLPELRARIQSTMAGLMVFMVIIIGASALTVYAIEHQLPHANIKTAEDALWWSLVTVSTVGYGDHYPVTMIGRMISVILILSGVSLFGVLSGYIASNFLLPAEKQDLSEQNKLLAELVEENRKLREVLKSEIDSLKQHNRVE